MEKVECPVCGGDAVRDEQQEETVYCENKKCSFMGVLP